MAKYNCWATILIEVPISVRYVCSNGLNLKCNHANYDEYFEVCEDCGKSGEAIAKEG